MSKSLKSVTCRTAPVASFHAHRFWRWSAPRSDMKYIVPPCHIGCASLASLLVTFRAASVARSKIQMSGAQPPRYRFHVRKSCDCGM